MQAVTSAGIPGVGELAWGSHCCHFYASRDDLVETLVPYFKTGLESNDACLWVTSEPFRAADARAALGAVVPDLAAREKRGQIEIVDHGEWYLREARHDAEATLEGWIRREELALRSGYQGLRLTGNTYWLEREDWASFVEYERVVNESFCTRRIVALCSYCAERCSASDVLDVVANHRFTVARRDGMWHVLESAALEIARQDLLRVQRAANALRESDRRKNAFLATLAHELRNPLAPLRSWLEILKHADSRPDLLQRAYATLDRQVGQLERLVDDLLDVARITRDRLELRRQKLELATLVEHALETCRPQIDAAGVVLSVELPDEPIHLHGDPLRLAQVLCNLIGNACKYTPPRGRVSLDVRRDGTQVRLAVRDTGRGIPPEMLWLVFEMFTQLEPSSEHPGGGLGIGLALARRLVEMHGGTVEAHSEGPGRGSEFVVRLPMLLTPRARAPEAPARAAPAAPRRRVLVVDDNADAADAVATLLELSGHETRVAHDGETAIRLAEDYRPDVVLLDLGLPKLSGHDAARWIRQQPWGREIALVALTGWGQEEDRRRSREAGFDHHLTKPIDASALTKLLADERRW